jgi:3-hydroxybutyryl-CoA dehydrogenase
LSSERVAPADAILASNTSALAMTRIAAGLLGAHFWNPPHLVPLVEIVLPASRSAAGRFSVPITRARSRCCRR